MAIHRVCSVMDTAAGFYLQPFHVPSLGIATRDFSDACADPKSQMSRHRSDFILFHIADFDDSTGEFSQVMPARQILRGADVLVGGGDEG